MPLSLDVLNSIFSITLNKKNPTQNILISRVRVQAEDAITGEKFDFLADEISL
ncbi:MAG: hypothetical protein AAB724_01480 [Patescibacteria group bacterium]